jgi:hypothetical protein
MRVFRIEAGAVSGQPVQVHGHRAARKWRHQARAVARTRPPARALAAAPVNVAEAALGAGGASGAAR